MQDLPDENPSKVTAQAQPDLRGLFPWADYTPFYHSKTKEKLYRIPKSFYCIFCRNTYKNSNLNIRFKRTLQQYSLEISKPTSDCARSHNDFLQLREDHIKGLQELETSGKSRTTKSNIAEAKEKATKLVKAIRTVGVEDSHRLAWRPENKWEPCWGKTPPRPKKTHMW